MRTPYRSGDLCLPQYYLAQRPRLGAFARSTRKVRAMENERCLCRLRPYVSLLPATPVNPETTKTTYISPDELSTISSGRLYVMSNPNGSSAAICFARMWANDQRRTTDGWFSS